MGAYWCFHYAWYKAKGGRPLEHKEGMKSLYKHYAPPASSVSALAVADTPAIEVEVLSPQEIGSQMGANFRAAIGKGEGALIQMAKLRGRAMGKAALQACIEEAQETFEAGMAAIEGTQPQN